GQKPSTRRKNKLEQGRRAIGRPEHELTGCVGRGCLAPKPCAPLNPAGALAPSAAGARGLEGAVADAGAGGGRLGPPGLPSSAQGGLGWRHAPDAYPTKGQVIAASTLPDLDYDHGALAPSMSGRIMELHHSKHHATYVKGANTALEKLAAAREAEDFTSVNQFSKDLAFNLGGHTNHSIFWKNLSPEGGDKPTGELAAAIDEFFGSFDAFRAHFTAAALGIQGSGWAVLAYEPIGGNLVIEQFYDQQNGVPVATIPLFQLDM